MFAYKCIREYVRFVNRVPLWRNIVTRKKFLPFQPRQVYLSYECAYKFTIFHQRRIKIYRLLFIKTVYVGNAGKVDITLNGTTEMGGA